MTTPTPLAETIARLEKTHGNLLRNSNDQASVSYVDLRALLACARRCEAIDGIDSESLRRLDELIAAVTSEDEESEARIHILQLLRDAASERDALAKRVESLESELLIAWEDDPEVARLRAENERLAQHYAQIEEKARLATERLTAAQDRVRELEDVDGKLPPRLRLGRAMKENAELRASLEAIREARERWETSCGAGSHRAFADAVTVALGTSNQPGPITDPTQGVAERMTPIFREAAAAAISKHHAAGHSVTGLINGELTVVAPPGRPSCVPADCQHYIELPSGLWAWVREDDYGGLVFIERRDAGPNRMHWRISETMPWPTCDVPGITPADFLAARALGVRVLGWAK